MLMFLFNVPNKLFKKENMKLNQNVQKRINEGNVVSNKHFYLFIVVHTS